jgi:hypothetical protein
MIEFITFLAAISIASERVVEVIKNALDLTKRVPHEKTRVAFIHALAIISGSVMAYTVGPPVAAFKTIPGCIVVGLMCGAGSSVWNSLLSIMTELKGKVKS